MVKLSIFSGVRSCRVALDRALGRRRSTRNWIADQSSPGRCGPSRRRLCAAILSIALWATAMVTVRGALPASATTRPNIVVVLADDLDTSLVNYVDPGTGQPAMPNLQSLLAAQGMSFDNY